MYIDYLKAKLKRFQAGSAPENRVSS